MTASVERIGQGIVAWRKSLDLSRHELAMRSGLHRSSLSRIERGHRVPKVRTLKKIGTALGAGRVFLSDVTIVGRRIRLLRTLYLLSQTEFARLCRARKDQLSEWERGVIVPSVASLRRICRVFGVGLDYFFLTTNRDEAVAAQHSAAMGRIGERVRQLCAARGLSQREVARRGGFKWNTL